MTAAALEAAARAAHLAVLGRLHEAGETVFLLGPGAGFWPAFSRSAEFLDGADDPMDRWSSRVIGALAAAQGGRAVFPFEGPPWPPFQRWAMASGQAWQSPVGMLVHARVGLWVSFRGAVILPGLLPLPDPGQTPCHPCAAPCASACPVAALTPEGYDVPRCRAYLRSPEGADCRERGCAVRRACPASAGASRMAAQSAFHMTHFLKSDRI